MEVLEKKSSKGGFLSFFDWGGESRKKLFPNNNGGELDGIKKVKENHDEQVPCYPLVEYDPNRANLTRKGSGEFNCASSTSSDDGYRTGAPSVVAKLMGLDSMPNANVCEPCSTQNMNSRFPWNGYIRGGSLNSRIEGFNMNYQYFSYNKDGFSSDPLIMTPQKIHGRPIERFQTEILPPRSAKTIPITHHKLLSPIKSPGFTHTKNASYIMEAASKMIDPNPRTAVHGRMSSQASPSIPLRIRDLKDRMEASQKSLMLQKAKENAVRSNVNRKEVMTLNGSVDVPKMKAPISSVRSSPDSTRIRGKVGPRSEVVRSNTQRREGPASSSTKNFPSKVFNESVSKQAMKRSQQGSQRNVEQQKVAAVKTLSVLRKNNQKQNDTQSGDSLASNSSASNQQAKKSLPTNFSMRYNKTGRKSALDDQTMSRKDVAATDTVKQYSMPKGMKTHQQKKPKSGTNHSEDMMSDMVLVSKDGKSIQCNAVIDGSSSWGLGNNKDVMDVISFTFASPIKKPVSRSEDTGHVMGGGQPNGEGSYNLPNTKMLNLSPLRFNGIGVDALSILLDQKLKELTCRIDSASGTFNKSHETSFQDSALSSKVIRTSSDECNNISQYCVVIENSDYATETECTSDDLFPTSSWRTQEIEDCYSVNKNNESSKHFGVEPISVSYAEDAFLIEGACPRSENTCGIQDDKWCSEVNSFEATNTVSAEIYKQAACVVDPQEASNWKLAASYSCSVDIGSISWESEYVRDVISQAELVANNFLLGRVDNVIDSNLFDQLEDQPNWSDTRADGGHKLERKLLFDCISELANHRCQLLTTGCCRKWRKWSTFSKLAGSFSNELCKEICSWKNKEEELMVDEVVERDMSSGLGRWVDFDMEESEECIEMENIVLSSLVDELVADILI